MSQLQLSLLGPFRAAIDGRPLTNFTTAKSRALLALLAVESAQPHDRQELGVLFWPDRPAKTALTNLRQELCRLNRAIQTGDDIDHLLINSAELQFDRSSPHWMDTIELDAALKECTAHHPEDSLLCAGCRQRLADTISLYRGKFMADLSLPECEPFTAWQLIRRLHYHQQVLTAMDWLGASYERVGEYQQAADCYLHEIEIEPWSELAHRRRMRSLALSGQTSAAIHQFVICRQLLAEGLGVEPAQRTLNLLAQIREGPLKPKA